MGPPKTFLRPWRNQHHSRLGGKAVTRLLFAHFLKSNLLICLLFGLAILMTFLSLLSYPRVEPLSTQQIGQIDNSAARKKIEVEGFSVMLNGFHKERIPILKDVIHIYCQVQSIAKVYVTWGTLHDAPLAEELPCRVPVEVVIYPTPDLTNRFIIPKSLQTDAVLICDDDIFVAAADVQFVFEAFRENSDRIVGIFGRDFVEKQNKSFIYSNRQRSYSIMLTKFLFVHRRYLRAFPHVVPPKTMQYINEMSNCEDIALNIVVSKLSGLAPINVNVSAIDYGDSRAYAKDDAKLEAVRVSALSYRSAHKVQRSECLSRFRADFGKNYLRHTSAHISKYDGEQVFCRNGHDWVACQKAGKDNSLRKATSNFAYVSVLADNSPEHVMAANCWAKRLRDLHTPYDIVLTLVLDEGEKYDPDAFSEFTRVRIFHSIQGHRAGTKRQFNKFRIWQLTEYEKIVYIDLDVLVVENIDELFTHPDLSAAPDILTGDKFNSGLLVIKPNLAFAQLFRRNVDGIATYNKGDQGILNRLHDDWFSQDSSHRLSSRYNFLKMFPDHYNPPDWFDQDTVEQFVGPPKVVHFANPWFKPWLIPQTGAHVEKYSDFWRKACSIKSDEDETVQRAPMPAEDRSIILWGERQSVLTKKKKSTDLHVSRPTIAYSLNTTLSVFQDVTREVFATVYDSSLPNVLVWAQSLRATGTAKRLVIMAPNDVVPDEVKVLRIIFDRVHTSPIQGKQNPERELELIVELFNLKMYAKIVYYHPATLFIHNVDGLFEHPSVSAIPAAYPSDYMSEKMLVIDPNVELHRDLKSHVDASKDIPFFALNSFFHDWFSSTTPHRIPPSFHANLLFKPNLVKHIGSTRSFWIDSRWSPLQNFTLFSQYEHTKVARSIWIGSFCSAMDGLSKRPMSAHDAASTTEQLANGFKSACSSRD